MCINLIRSALQCYLSLWYLMRRALYLTAIVAAVLLLLSVIPADSYRSWGLRPVNLLFDLQSDAPARPKRKPKPAVTFKDSVHHELPCPQGMVCLEDYDSSKKLFLHFLRAADSCIHHQRPMRVAFFGDSYIEGDMLVADFRDSLQQVFGGTGVGFIPATSEVAGFRVTLNHSFSKDWKNLSIIGDPKTKEKFGIDGHIYIPSEGSQVRLSPVSKRHLNRFGTLQIYYSGAQREKVRVTVGKMEAEEITLQPGEGLQSVKLNINASHAVKLIFNQYGDLKIYGFSIDTDSGIYIDNFAMRGNSGIGLSLIRQNMFTEFQELHPYDLILLQYGLNVANEKYTDYSWYTRSMKKVIAHMKASFPGVPIVLIGVGDRGAKLEDGSMGTMRGIVELIDAQRAMAAEAGICFWDLYEAMGGEGSMVRMVDQGFANKDYTHLTWRGGKKIAGILSGTLLHEISKYHKTIQQP